MKISSTLLLIVTLGVTAACTDTDTYPITGAECGPEDPVKTIDAANCDVPGITGSGI